MIHHHTYHSTNRYVISKRYKFINLFLIDVVKSVNWRQWRESCIHREYMWHTYVNLVHSAHRLSKYLYLNELNEWMHTMNRWIITVISIEQLSFFVFKARQPAEGEQAGRAQVVRVSNPEFSVSYYICNRMKKKHNFDLALKHFRSVIVVHFITDIVTWTRIKTLNSTIWVLGLYGKLLCFGLIKFLSLSR